jgi:hypothetical protein
MTDRELLEAAAKAAGVTFVPWKDCLGGWNEPEDLWNPLTDDGDALRLAVRLNLSIDIQGDLVEVILPPDYGYISIKEVFSTDPYAATRRAIVMAAAEIGKTL